MNEAVLVVVPSASGVGYLTLTLTWFLTLSLRTLTVLTAQSFLLIDVKTLDAAGLTHVLTRHTDRVRL